MLIGVRGNIGDRSEGYIAHLTELTDRSPWYWLLACVSSLRSLCLCGACHRWSKTLI